MKDYIVFIKENKSEVVEKNFLSRDFYKSMKNKGFTRYPYTITARNEKEAIDALNKQSAEHLDALAEYTGSIFLLCLIIVISFLVSLIFFY